MKNVISLLLAVCLLTACAAPAIGDEKMEESMEMRYRLSNPNADVTTQEVYRFLCGLSGEHTLSAQQESTWMGSADYEMDYILKVTGKLPAMRGLDYMHDDFDGVNQRAVNWWKQGGLVTICWHTGADFCGEWKDCMEDSISDWDAVLTEGTPEHDTFVAGMDKAARALLELQEQGGDGALASFPRIRREMVLVGKGRSGAFCAALEADVHPLHGALGPP